VVYTGLYYPGSVYRAILSGWCIAPYHTRVVYSTLPYPGGMPPMLSYTRVVCLPCCHIPGCVPLTNSGNPGVYLSPTVVTRVGMPPICAIPGWVCLPSVLYPGVYLSPLLFPGVYLSPLLFPGLGECGCPKGILWEDGRLLCASFLPLSHRFCSLFAPFLTVLTHLGTPFGRV